MYNYFVLLLLFIYLFIQDEQAPFNKNNNCNASISFMSHKSSLVKVCNIMTY